MSEHTPGPGRADAWLEALRAFPQEEPHETDERYLARVARWNTQTRQAAIATAEGR